jgi:hypothetical protein
VKRSGVVAISLVGTALIGYVAAGPFITIHQIKSAMARKDPEALASNVDFPALRVNLKEEINAIIARQSASGAKGNQLNLLQSPVLSNMVELAVDKLVTANSLAGMASGSGPLQAESDRAQNASENPNSKPFKNARYTYDSFSKFSAWVPSEGVGNIRFVFTRHDLSWTLSNIVLPLDEPIADRRHKIR